MIRKIFIVLFLSFTCIVFGQRATSSPYSYFGIGDEFSARTVEQNAMGGIGVAFSHYKYLNFTNPAAYSDLRFTTYSLGALNNDLKLKTGRTSQSSTSTNLSYVALAFPIGSKAGFSLGLQPLSSVGYSLTNFERDDNSNVLEATFFEGNGGVNRLFGAFGIKVIKNLSLGIEADFSFGSVENRITSQRANVALLTRYEENTTIRGGSVKLGAQYQKELKNDLFINAGTTFKFSNDLNVTGTDRLYTLAVSQFGEEERDIGSSTPINGTFNLPLKSTFGIGVGKLDKWYVGAEYETQDAFSTTGLLATTTGSYRYDDSNRISIGGYYLPKINSISSYWDRITYRAGVRIEKTGLLADGSGANTNFTEINDFGISFGLGLPLKRLSTVNLGFEFGKRGTTENNLIEENYFNLRLSLSLTDVNWFVKRKID